MGIVASFMDRRVGAELDERRVLVWYDPARAWQPWIQTTHGEPSPGEEATAAQVTIGGRDAHLVISTGSHYEVLQACEPLVSGSEPPRLLVYVPGEPYLEMLSPLRELECLGGEKEPYQRELTQVARQALQSAGLSESKIDELLNRDGLDLAYLDSISVGDGGASPLAPVFGTSRETEVIPRFLAEADRRDEAAAKGLLVEVAKLANLSLGLPLGSDASPDKMADELARVLLVAEMRSDLQGPEPVAISQLPKPQTAEQVDRIQRICKWLRRDYPDFYEQVAEKVEGELGLASADLDPLTLGQIDTFRFEERRLLEACGDLLVEGETERALEIVRDRSSSFWTSIGRFPERHAAWQACGALAQLALSVAEVTRALKQPPTSARGWVDAYTAPEGWHRVDQRFREARYRLTRLQDALMLERGADHVFASYDALLEQMATGFVAALQAAGWQVDGTLRQEQVYERYVARHSGPVAYLLADAMRFEMGADLAELLEAVGATSLRLEPAIAAAPSITDLGMAALLPGAERSFSMVESPKGVTGAVRGKALVGSPARMDYAKGAVPQLAEMTLNRFVHELSLRKREEAVKGASVFVVRSQEIDGIGENLPDGVVRTVMGTILEDLRSAVQCLADAGVHRFVVVADHGHLFGDRRGDDMKIDPPEGGTTVDLHRRCWIGRGGSTPSACVRLSASDLGYEGTDLELVVPKGMGVFKAGGSLAFHHGGLSLQELIIPVLSFELKGRKATKKKSGGDLIALEGVPKSIQNLIFSFRVRRLDLPMEPLQIQFVVETRREGKTTTGGQAITATRGWDSAERILTLEAGEQGKEPVSVAIQIDDEEAEEVRVTAVQVGTDRALKDTPPIPVQVTK